MAHGFKGFLSGVFYVQLAVWFALWGGSAYGGPAEDALKIQAEWSALLLRIESKVQALKLQLSTAGVEYETDDLDRLWRKVGPQARLQTRPLVIMLMGQHNSGKSTVLNLLIGATPKTQVTQISDIGGSTTMPVALLNSAFPDKDLPLLFGGFEIKKLSRPTDATQTVPEGKSQLLWAKSNLVPPSVALVDTPDLDSYHIENSVQTRAMIDVADVVAVMITDQYANRDVVKALKEVASAKKPVILIFNKADLENEYELWPKRLAELKKVTGIEVLDAFVIEKNAAKAKVGEPLDFFRVGPSASERAAQVPPLDAVMDLDVQRIRIQTELGALQQAIDGATGLEAFVNRVAEINSALATLRALLDETSKQAPTMVEWPRMPAGPVGQAILETWGKYHRGMTTKLVRQAPYWLRKGLGNFMRALWNDTKAKEEREYRQAEFEFLRDHIVKLVLNELESLRNSKKASGRLAAVIEEALHPVAVSTMQSKLQATHEHMNLVDKELEGAIQVELNRLKDKHPTLYGMFQNGDTILAGMELLGAVAMWLGSCYLLQAPLLSNFVTSVISAPIQTTAGAAAATAATPATTAASDKLRNFALRQPFENIVRQYANKRIVWTMNWLRQNYLKAFYDELEKTSAATGVVEVGDLRETISCARRLADTVRATAKVVKKT